VFEVRGSGARVAFDPEWCCPTPRCRWPAGRLRRGKGKRRLPCGNIKTISARFSRRRHPLDHAAGETHAQAARAIDARGWQSGFSACWGCWEKEYATTLSEPKRQRLEAFRGAVVCPECGGTRLRPEARSVRVAGRAIHEVTALTVAAARQFFAGLDRNVSLSLWERGRGQGAVSGMAARSTEYGVRSAEQGNSIANHQSEIRNQKSEIPHPSSPQTSSRSPSRSSARSPRGWNFWTAWAWAI